MNFNDVALRHDETPRSKPGFNVKILVNARSANFPLRIDAWQIHHEAVWTLPTDSRSSS